MSTVDFTKARNHAAKGFTLIELLVVLVLLGLIAGVAVVTIGLNNQSRELENEIKRLHALMRYASDEAVLQNSEIGFYVDSESYEFLIYDDQEQKWSSLGAGELRKRALPEWVSVELKRDNEQKELPVPEDSEDLKPLVIFLSSGESSQFELFFFIKNGDKSGLSIRSDGYSAIELVTPVSDDED